MRMAGMLVIMGMFMPVTRFDADQVENERSYASFSLHAVGKVAQCHRWALQHDALKGAAVIERHRSCRRDKIVMSMLHLR